MATSDSIAACGIELFPHERLALVKGRPVDLTAREFDILMRLASHPGWIYSAEQLADGEEWETDFSPDSVRVHVAHLRRKLALADAEGLVCTVRGAGYRLQGGVAGGPGRPLDESALDGECVPEPDAYARIHRLRDAFWLLERAVLEFEQAATGEQIEHACEALDVARRTIAGLLTDGTP
ncbi:MAG: winged helix-turn-helix domain-containing protein [Coriobacteriia bacterium]|nr:winged helix-turn-helix domain-containing protein [Coriobacteriia bacterium]